jgi:hypothetical protein
MKRNTVILFLTHFIDNEFVSQYQNIKNDCDENFDIILLYDNTRGDFNPALFSDRLEYFTFILNDLRKMGYSKCKTIKTTIDPNYETPLLLFYLRNPHYSYYWVVEYDVRFTGSWNDFFSYFNENNADLLGTTLFRYDVRPGWRHWRYLQTPGIKLKKTDLIRGYFPIYRLSKSALEKLHKAYMTGWAGHCEATIPTILRYSGLRIEDIGGDGEFTDYKNINRFYRNTPKNKGLSPGTFVFRPIMPHPGDEKNMLWHPVKAHEIDWTKKAQKNLWYRAKKSFKRRWKSFFCKYFWTRLNPR